jgi:methyl-accepting chemotaxis protein
MNFSKTINDYLSWKIRFKGYLTGQAMISESEIVSHEDCDLGRWLYSKGLSQYGAIPEIARLEKVHMRLHKSVLNIVKMGNNIGDFGSAHKELIRFEALFMDFFFLLDRLRRTAK